MEWRLVTGPPAPGAVNMAVDHALLEGVHAGGPPVLRFYAWDPHCVSIGRNQPYDAALEAAAARAGADLVRRPTGGAAVHHHRELTYAVAVHVGLLGSPRATYLVINEALVAGLRRLGVPAAVAAGVAVPAGVGAGAAAARALAAASLAPSAAAPCFRAAAPGEVVVGGRKLVGSAQRRERRSILQHGSLLLSGDQSLAGLPPAGDSTTLAEALGGVPAWDDLCAALAGGFRERLGARLAASELAPSEVSRVPALAGRYRSAAWTRRR